MSPSSIAKPSALLSTSGAQLLSSASAFGSGNFTGLLLQALQSGNASAAGSSAAAAASGARGARATTGLAGAIGHGHLHGHHGGSNISAQRLLQMLEQIHGSGAGRTSALTAPAAAAATPALGAASASGATAAVTLQALLQNLPTGAAAPRGIGRLLNTQA